MLTLVRWKLRRAGPPFDCQRELILRYVIPARNRLHGVSSYVSRQNCTDVWLTVIGESGLLQETEPALEPLLGSDLIEREGSDSDVLLRAVAAPYRGGLERATDIALQLLAQSEYRRHQIFLTMVKCS